MKRLLLTIILGLFLISLTSAGQSSLGTFKQGTDVNLIQTCSSCSEINITQIKLSGGTLLNINEAMQKDGSFFNYTLDKQHTSTLGKYIVNGIGDVDGTNTVFAYDFEVTPSGDSGNENIFLFIIVLVLGYTLNLLGFFNKNTYITILGGIILVFTGLYMINYGIIIFRSNLTLAISYVTLFWGAGSSLWAAVEEIQDSM